MCTVFVYRQAGGFLGRNLDLDTSFGEKVVITPRGYRFPRKCGEDFRTEFAMTGMASVAGTYPLYAEAVNEAGLAMAGLNFPKSAVYRPYAENLENVTPYELILWVLGRADSVAAALQMLAHVCVLAEPFAAGMPLAPLHFFLADRERSAVAEPVAEGLKIYEDPYNVLTNEPPFPWHDWNMRNYRNLRTANGESAFAPGLELPAFAEGMGGIGLPGDLSSPSRFVRAAFTLANSECAAAGEENFDAVTQVFHILDSVAMTRGTVVTAQGGTDITRYSCCISLAGGTYFYKTYGNSRITAVPMGEEQRATETLSVYELRTEQDIAYEK